MYKCHVNYDRGNDEYTVIVKKDGKRIERLCYYTSDKEDAIGTMRLMEKDFANHRSRPDKAQTERK